MSTSKHINAFCIAVLIITLLLTVAFIKGKDLGIAPVTEEETADSYFTANDQSADWDTSGATEIMLSDSGSSVKGDGAYVFGGDVYIVSAGRYVLSGELTGGSVIIDAGKKDKVWLLMDGASLHANDTAALLVQQAGKVFLTLGSGTENSISCGSEFSEDAASAGIDGAVYARDDLTINGSGVLTVTGEYRHGIVCKDDLVITGGTIGITAAQDGIHVSDSAGFKGADLTINAGDDGITVSNDEETGYVYIESGDIQIPSCYEGIEANEITIAGGTIYITPTDDGINACGRGANSVINITGGDITIINETGRDADGLDSNGSIYISGGTVFISVSDAGGSSCAIDYGSENGGICEINGGTVVAAGSSAKAGEIAASSKQCFIMYSTQTVSPKTAVTLQNSAGTVLLSEIIP